MEVCKIKIPFYMCVKCFSNGVARCQKVGGGGGGGGGVGTQTRDFCTFGKEPI